MNAEQRQTAVDFWTKPMDLSHRPACRRLGNYIHYRHLIYYSTRKDKLILILPSHFITIEASAVTTIRYAATYMYHTEVTSGIMG